MDTLEAISHRVSCRTFLDKPVPKEVLEKIVDAGRRAPTANNSQPVEFVVVTDTAKLANIAQSTDYGHFIKNAPACIVVLSTNTKYFLEDGCAAMENILIAATALGLGTCWVAGDKKQYSDYVCNVVNAPEDFKLIALTPLGYPAKDRPPHNKRPLADVLHWDKF